MTEQVFTSTKEHTGLVYGGHITILYHQKQEIIRLMNRSGTLPQSYNKNKQAHSLTNFVAVHHDYYLYGDVHVCINVLLIRHPCNISQGHIQDKI
jgi:hypothetical protein